MQLSLVLGVARNTETDIQYYLARYINDTYFSKYLLANMKIRNYGFIIATLIVSGYILYFFHFTEPNELILEDVLQHNEYIEPPVKNSSINIEVKILKHEKKKRLKPRKVFSLQVAFLEKKSFLPYIIFFSDKFNFSLRLTKREYLWFPVEVCPYFTAIIFGFTKMENLEINQNLNWRERLKEKELIFLKIVMAQTQDIITNMSTMKRFEWTLKWRSFQILLLLNNIFLME